MSNTFGRFFRVTTFGESHGPAVGVVIDGVPAGISLKKQEIQKELDRRRPGQSKATTSRSEKDKVEILCGIFEDKTIGSPICLVVYNKDADPFAYKHIKDLYRPGHADYTFQKKYGHRDYRGGGRQSGRETLARVAAGAIAKKILSLHDIRVIAYTLQVHEVKAETIDYKVIEKNPVRCPDKNAAKLMLSEIEKAKEEGDSLGGIVECVVNSCPIGLGDPVFEKLDAKLSHAIVSIGAVKSIEFGMGFGSAVLKGSENNDEFDIGEKGKVHLKTNNAGGISGGISNGEQIVFRAAIKPPSSIGKEQSTIDVNGKRKNISVQGRHDPCLCPRMVPVIESMTAITLVDALFAQKLIS